MKARLASVLCRLSSVLCVSARAETVRLTLNQVFTLDQVLAQLDAGVTHVVKGPAAADGADPVPEKIVTTAYDFSPGTRLAIYRDRRELQAQLTDFEKARAAIVKKIWGDKQPDEKNDLAQMARFKVELADQAAVEVKVEITRLKAEDLYRNGNPIPSSVMLGLQPILADK